MFAYYFNKFEVARLCSSAQTHFSFIFVSLTGFDLKERGMRINLSTVFFVSGLCIGFLSILYIVYSDPSTVDPAVFLLGNSNGVQYDRGVPRHMHSGK